ncbi:copper chaperone PCu(A)C [Rhizobium sp. BK251]|uniref:copper chaperone PCu(A)C n=1 Tax=Rhizobium sp. BK251 TaxID=2512125 RepID=UPI001052B2E4|nr:copper chaperone PCu(A)C [Rhizobium sp. BK251]TCL73612.1 hypothetical protein EV286_103143 [Rhizobium sp. BK251]
MRFIRTMGLSALICASATTASLAHVTFLDNHAPQDRTSLLTLQIPHGCDGKATTEVRVKLPEGFVFAKPQPKPGWELEVIKGDYQRTYDNHGDAVKSGPLEIRWKNGNLSDDFYDTFVIQGKVSGVAAGGSLAFPVTQLCGADASVTWDEVATEGADPHSLKNPAPVLEVVAGQGHGADHDMAGMAGMDMAGMSMAGTAGTGDAGPTAKVGAIEVSGAFAKAMLPGQPVGGGFMSIHNGGSDDRLVSVVSPAAGRVEIHEMKMQDNVMKMRELSDGLAIPAGQTVALAPGGLHLMFMQVKQPFKEGMKVPVTLTFEKAGSVSIDLDVKSAKGN